MKKLLIFAFLLCAGNAFAQKDTIGLNIPFVNQSVVYEKVYDVPKAPQNLLYSNARVWFAGTHPDGGKTQLTLRDTILSRVAGRSSYAIDIPYKILWQTDHYQAIYNFTVQIDCKDNKYRLRIYNPQYGSANTPLEEMVQSLAKSKSLTLGNGIKLSKNDLRESLQLFSKVVNNLLADVNKKMVDDNNF
jgi:hypothetical protein